MSHSSYPPLDSNLPPEARVAVLDRELRELRHTVDDLLLFTPEQHELLLWTIDYVRGSRMIVKAIKGTGKGAAWAMAAVGTVVAAMQAYDWLVARFFAGVK